MFGAFHYAGGYWGEGPLSGAVVIIPTPDLLMLVDVQIDLSQAVDCRVDVSRAVDALVEASQATRLLVEP